MKTSSSHAVAASRPPRRSRERVEHRHRRRDGRVRDVRELRRRVIAPDRDAARSRRAARRAPRRAGPTARLWSRRVSAVNRSAGTPGADAAAMSAFVLAGLPTTTTRTSSAATASIAAPCGPKMPAFAASRSARSMPGPRGRAPTSSAMLAAVERDAADRRSPRRRAAAGTRSPAARARRPRRRACPAGSRAAAAGPGGRGRACRPRRCGRAGRSRSARRRR